MEVRKSLQQQFPVVMSTNIRDLTPAQCSYVLSVLHAEMIRGAQGKIDSLFVYLSHLSTISAPVVPFIRAISELVLPIFIDFWHKQKQRRPEWEARLEDCVQFLLVKFCHREYMVRVVSDKYLRDVCLSFPQMLWSRTCLNTLLALIKIVSNVCNSNYFDSDLLIIHNVPDCKHELLLPDDNEDRRVLLANIMKLGTVWIEAALSRAPMELGSILQEFVQSYPTISDEVGLVSPAERAHSGLSLVLRAGLKGNQLSFDTATAAAPMGVRQTVGNMLAPSAAAESVGYFVETFAKECLGSTKMSGPVFVSSLKTKSMYAGEVSGMMNLLQQSSSIVGQKQSASSLINDEHKDRIMSLIVDNIIRNLTEVISNVRKYSGRVVHDGAGDAAEKGISGHAMGIDLERFEADMYRGVAILIQQPRLNSDLLHVVCWAPFVTYTPQSINTGVFAWRWLVAARPEFHLEVMNELKDVWEWTIEERIGLFSDTPRPLSPLAITQGPVSQTSAGIRAFRERMSDIRPHRIFVDWVIEHFTVVRTRSTREKEIYGEILVAALKNPQHFSKLKGSMSTRFKFLLFCFDFLHSKQAGDTFLEHQIRTGVYFAAASWFHHRPVWHTFASNAEAEEEIGCLIDFCKAIEKDKANMPKGAGGAGETPHDREMNKWLEDVFGDLEKQKRRRNTGPPPMMSDRGHTRAESTTMSSYGQASDDLDTEQQRKRGWSIRTTILDSKRDVSTIGGSEATGPSLSGEIGSTAEGHIARNDYFAQIGRLLQLLLGHEVRSLRPLLGAHCDAAHMLG